MLLKNLQLIDGTGSVQTQIDIRIRNGRFQEVAQNLTKGEDQIIDLTGSTAIPGLIDAHTHISLNASPTAIEDAAEQPHPYQRLHSGQSYDLQILDRKIDLIPYLQCWHVCK